MNQIFRIVLIFSFAAVSCSKEVINGDDLPKILADIYMTDRTLLSSPTNIQKADSMFIYEPILNKYGYTTEDLTNTIDFYLPRPQKLKSFFMEGKAILEKREMAVKIKLAELSKKDSLLAPIIKFIGDRDSLKKMDSYERSLRWMIAPEKFPLWRIYLPDSLKVRFEIPKLEQWWLNNMTTTRKSLLHYEKNSRTILIPVEPTPNQERFSLPPH